MTYYMIELQTRYMSTMMVFGNFSNCEGLRGLHLSVGLKQRKNNFHLCSMKGIDNIGLLVYICAGWSSICFKHAHRFRADAVGARPGVSSTPSHLFHVVQWGDNLTLIAKKYRSSVTSIASANNIDDVDYLQAGRILLIPVSSRASDLDKALLEEQKSQLEMGGKLVLSQGDDPFVSRIPYHSNPPAFTLALIKPILFTLLSLAVVGFGGKHLVDLAKRKRDDHFERREREMDAEAEAEATLTRGPKMTRWQGVLNGDRAVDAYEAYHTAEGHPLSMEEAHMYQEKLEEEKLQQSYMELESAYAKFLADSGLSKIGYWRGGIPSAKDEK